jgi:4-hydroxy-tetrahydrodipicolinate synthase
MDRPVAPRGSLTPLVTPFRDGEVDERAFRALVERQVAGGSHGITVAGTTGEPAALSLSERERLVELAVEAAEGRLPVLAGTGTNELGSTLRLTRAAERLGAAAVLVVSPYYVKPNQRGLADWFRTVADATGLPVILYDIPGRTGVALEPATIAQIVDAAPNVVGVKAARPDLDQVSRVLAECGPEFGVYCGLESLCFPMLALGGAGHVSASGNVAPGAVAELAEAAFAGNWTRARELHFRLRPINEAVFYDTNPVPIKTMLAALGLITAELRPPLAPPDEPTSARILGVLDEFLSQDSDEKRWTDGLHPRRAHAHR